MQQQMMQMHGSPTMSPTGAIPANVMQKNYNNYKSIKIINQHNQGYAKSKAGNNGQFGSRMSQNSVSNH